ncbi:MAG: putative toxin-antitoxin system toxin component, PIN family [Olsenella umbonata]|nr:putative toxin-antitoxin system toxin component, PIN family [Parafannyhessea umbonata]
MMPSQRCARGNAHEGRHRHQRRYLRTFEAALSFIRPQSKVEVCRDPDDDKFLGCAIDARAIHIVSGDKDLLTIGEYSGIEIVTAAEFCERYLK